MELGATFSGCGTTTAAVATCTSVIQTVLAFPSLTLLCVSTRGRKGCSRRLQHSALPVQDHHRRRRHQCTSATSLRWINRSPSPWFSTPDGAGLACGTGAPLHFATRPHEVYANAFAATRKLCICKAHLQGLCKVLLDLLGIGIRGNQVSFRLTCAARTWYQHADNVLA